MRLHRSARLKPCPDEEKSPQARILFSQPGLVSMNAMSTLTELGTQSRRPASRQVQAPARPSGGPNPVHFYSTITPNRNVRNSLKTNNRCTSYSTEDRGGLRPRFSPISAHQSPTGQAPASTYAGLNPVHFYSTITPNRNVRNPLKTNNRCTVYSTQSCSIFSGVFHHSRITTHQSRRGLNG